MRVEPELNQTVFITSTIFPLLGYRCVNCKTSFDVCSSCETRLSSAAGGTDAVRHYDGRHSFAVFKRLVDLDLLRSLVDDVQEEGDWQVGSRGTANGSSGRAMVEFLLV